MNASTPATKTKRTLLERKRPPQDIRDNTRERRAWIERVIAEVNAQPGLEARSVESGSYQHVAVYKVTEVAGRLRHRGVCQFCGHSQVVSSALMVLHGYTRPGDGYIWGKCPGVGLEPLNCDKTHTERWLAQAQESERRTSAELSEASLRKHASSRTLHDTAPAAELAAGFREKPRLRSRPSREDEERYRVLRAEWAAKFPLHAAARDAEKAFEAARVAHRQAESNVGHFTLLLQSGVHGTPLQEEVVTD